MDFTTILEAVLALAAAVITCYIIPYIKTKTTTAEQETITQWISVAVAAAEQLGATGLVDDKLEYVENYLDSIGVSVTREEIEASVYWLAETVVEELTVEEVDGEQET